MKKYYTIIQGFDCYDLSSYFQEHGIKYHISADFIPVVNPTDGSREEDLVKIYTVLLDDTDLLHIKLIFSDVNVTKNNKYTEFKNKVREFFTWKK